MTVKAARDILEQDAVGLTDNEVQEISDWLNMMADITIELVENKINPIKQDSVKLLIPPFKNTKQSLNYGVKI